jgi:hypothetical protein
MIPLTISQNIEKDPWTECKDIPEMADVIRIGRLPNGTYGGRSSVSFLIKRSSGELVLAQTTLRLLQAAVIALTISAEQEGEYYHD